MITMILLFGMVYGIRYVCYKQEDSNMPIYKVDTDDKKISLSFDVAWGSNNIDEILNILDKHNAKATFFYTISIQEPIKFKYRVNLYHPAREYRRRLFTPLIMEGAYRKRRFIYREAHGAAAWRPAVMRTVPSANGREMTLRGRDHQSRKYVRSSDQEYEKGLRQQSDRRA